MLQVCILKYSNLVCDRPKNSSIQKYVLLKTYKPTASGPPVIKNFKCTNFRNFFADIKRISKPEAYSEPSQIFKMGFFTKIVNGLQRNRLLNTPVLPY